jgi:NAD+ synthase (glutamine-hydrolysing)
MKPTPFDSICRHGFVRLAIGIPAVRLGNPLEHAERTVKLAERASDEHAAVVAFPELYRTSR